jgi:hypothetical protein
VFIAKNALAADNGMEKREKRYKYHFLILQLYLSYLYLAFRRGKFKMNRFDLDRENEKPQVTLKDENS